jgi:hypothetical protein
MRGGREPNWAAATGAGLSALVFVLSATVAMPANLNSLLIPQGSALGRVVAAPFRDEIQRDVTIATDFPTSTTGFGYSYRYDMETGAFVRSSRTLGSTFVERPDTIGRGLLDFHLTYFHASFSSKDGQDLDGLVEHALFRTVGLLNPGTITFEQFALTSDAFYLTFTYGVLDNLDASLLLPLKYTRLETSQLASTPAGGSVRSAPRSAAAFGVGDVQLRLKYCLAQGTRFDAAGLFDVRAPSGDTADFQGLGDWFVTPGITGSVHFEKGRFFPDVSVYANALVDVDVTDARRSRVVYGIGPSVALLDWLTLDLEFLGKSGVSSDTKTEFIPHVTPAGLRLGGFEGVELVPRGSAGTEVVQTFPRQDIIDIAPSVRVRVCPDLNRILKMPFCPDAVAFVGALVPLNNTGVRADAVFVVGIEHRR